MSKKKKRLIVAQEKTQEAIDKTNEKIMELGDNTSSLYSSIESLQNRFEQIRNKPDDDKIRYEEIKRVRLEWKNQAEKIESDYRKATLKDGGKAAVGVSAGITVAAMGPTLAMGVATTFGVAPTGTAISTLSGAAATNAALAWLGGGALAAGGGGMAAGEGLLALAGPIGWAIGGIALLSTGILYFKHRKDKKKLDDIFTLMSSRDVTSYELAIVELNERIKRIKDENKLLSDAINEINTFGLDYKEMTEKQQYTLGSYLHLMNSSTQLLVNPVKGLEPKYTEDDHKKFKESKRDDIDDKFDAVIISLCNLLYKIDIDEKGKKLLRKSFKRNKKMLKELDISKKEFKKEKSIMDEVECALNYKYEH